MSLKLALKAHQAGDLSLAKKYYSESFSAGDKNPVLYQNYGALLRQDAKTDSALEVYEKGLALFPVHHGILTNSANLLWDMGRVTSSIELNLRALTLLLASANKDNQKCIDAVSDLALEQLSTVNCFALAFDLLRVVAPYRSLDCRFLLAIRLLYSKYISSGISDEELTNTQLLDEILESKLEDADDVTRVKIKLILASTSAKESGIEESISQFMALESELKSRKLCENSDSDRIRDIWTTHSWNFASKLLQHQQFKLGWRLFDYGLVTQAPGKQMWQRALKKPFSSQVLPLWKGESLAHKSLLILEEQAIGDIMMFLTLLPSLLREAKHCGILLTPRLLSIYKRSFRKYIDSGQLTLFNSVKHASFPDPDNYDYQVALGSIMQFRHTDINCYGREFPVLIHDIAPHERFHARYRSSQPKSKLIGLSWRGGGHQKRQREKSISISTFASCLRGIQQLHDVQYISLQYGDVSRDIELFSNYGVSVIHDEEVNPIKDMDLWLSLVSSCDAVISVANTTIHGSGGLAIPTACLLSTQFDWRWLSSESVTGSYWYPSVSIFRQTLDSKWSSALDGVSQWIADGFPLSDPASRSMI